MVHSTWNRRANYYTEIGSYSGAVKLKGKWVRAQHLNCTNKEGWIRWAGPPSPAIQAALKRETEINYKNGGS